MWIPDPASPDGGFYRPDPRHPKHPYNQALGDDPRLARRLRGDPSLHGFVDKWAPIARNTLMSIVEVVRTAGPTAETRRHVDSFLAQLYGEAGLASERLGPPDIPAWIKHRYVLRRVVPDELLPPWVAPIDPVTIFARPDGYIVMGFTGATLDERHAYDPLITEAQRHFRHQKEIGGRPPDEERGALAREVARLRATTDLKAWQIADRLGIDYGGDRRRATELVGRLKRDGKRRGAGGQ